MVIVSPDSDNLSILQAAVLGVDLRSHARLFGFAPGEVRELRLSDTDFDAEPRSFACPNPPSCKPAAAAAEAAVAPAAPA